MRRKAALSGFLWLVLFLVPSTGHATVIDVPNDWLTIKLAESVASTGDSILVTEDHLEDEKVTIDVPDLSLQLNPGVTVMLTADGTDNVALNITADGVLVDGDGRFTIRAGTSPTGIAIINGESEIRNCTLEDDGNSFTAGGVDLFAGAVLSDCTVTLTSGQGRAVRICDSDATDQAVVEGSTLNVTLSGGGTLKEGVYVDSGTNAVIDGNEIVFSGSNGKGIVVTDHAAEVTNNVIRGTGARGIETTANNMTIRGNQIENFTFGIHMLIGTDQTLEHNTIALTSCSGGSYGIWLGGSYGSTLDLANNLIVNAGTGILFNQSVKVGWTITHNAYWTDSGACGTGSDESLTSTELNTSLEPIFCDERESTVRKYSHRIDSNVAPGNNPWNEVVGALGVECAWDTLQSSSTLLAGEYAIVLEDVIVPSGMTLTMGANSALEFDGNDQSNRGQQFYTSLNELLVDGELQVSGSGGNPARFVSSQASPSEGDWYGIVFSNSNTDESSVDYAEVTDAEAGITVLGGEVEITNSAFQDNAGYDIRVVNSNSTNGLIQDNTIIAGGGTGVEIDVSTSMTLDILDNEITGNGDTDYGLRLKGGNPTVTGNTVEDVTNGPGVEITADAPVLTENTIDGNKWGVYLTGGAAEIGDAADNQSDNAITNNTRGIYAFCTGAGACPACSGFAPKVRQSSISSNTTGVYTEKRGTFIDLGTGGENGNNTFTGNSAYCIRNASNCDTISAVGNWFGAYPPTVCWSGYVDATSPLGSAPASSPSEIVRLDGRPLRLRGVFPNPVSGASRIRFALGDDARVEIHIFDVSGRLVRDLGTREHVRGEHEMTWDGNGRSGRPVSSGIYFVRVTADQAQEETTRVLVTR